MIVALALCVIALPPELLPIPEPLLAGTSSTSTMAGLTGLDLLDDDTEEVDTAEEVDDPATIADLAASTVPPEEKSIESVLPVETRSGDLADIVDPFEPFEIGKSEMLRDAWIDREAARDLLDDIDAIDRGTPPAWPEPGDVTWDIPISSDERVETWIRYFQGAGRERYRTWLARLTRFAPVFWPVLESHGLPRDTIFLSMIESGFSPRATSWAAAAGPWQFMPDTGRYYGLEVGFWVDERRDFETATNAAALYLKALYTEFGDWMLAWAAYNTGEGRIRRTVKRLNTTDFWVMSRSRHLYRETKHYVPKLIAAAVIAKQPEAYGIEPPEYLPPLVWDTVTVTTAVDLATLARACGVGVQVDELEALNPALVRSVTPPRREWTIRVPSGARLPCVLGLSAMPATERLTYRFHKIKKGETVEAIARTYSTTVDAIVKFNHLDPKSLGQYEALVVPFPVAFDEAIAVSPEETRWARSAPFTPLTSGASNAATRIHRVRSGDTLWKIAKKYGVSVASLRASNGLGRTAKLRLGQGIRIGK